MFLKKMLLLVHRWPLSLLGMVQKLLCLKKKCCGNKLSLLSFSFSGNRVVKITIASANFQAWLGFAQRVGEEKEGAFMNSD